MKLKSGNCELENEEEYGAYTVAPSTEGLNVPDSNGQESVNENSQSEDAVESIKNRKDIFNLGASFKLSQNKTFPLEQNNQLPWQPILEGNSLDKDNAAESSRSLFTSSEVTEIYEPILKDRRLLNKGRELQETKPKEEIVEPVLKATTPKVKKAKEMVFTESTSTTRRPEFIKITVERPKSAAQTQDETVTVQLFPFRLGELLQKAERYARETLLPLISIQAPKIFGFNFGNPNSEGEPRKPRYIPRYEQEAFVKSNQNISSLKQVKRASTQLKSQREQRNLFELLRSESLERNSEEQRSLNEVNYYTNMHRTENRALKPESPEYQPVFIDLPTYKPPKARKLSFRSSRRKSP